MWLTTHPKYLFTKLQQEEKKEKQTTNYTIIAIHVGDREFMEHKRQWGSLPDECHHPKSKEKKPSLH